MSVRLQWSYSLGSVHVVYEGRLIFGRVWVRGLGLFRSERLAAHAVRVSALRRLAEMERQRAGWRQPYPNE